MPEPTQLEYGMQGIPSGPDNPTMPTTESRFTKVVFSKELSIWPRPMFYQVLENLKGQKKVIKGVYLTLHVGIVHLTWTNVLYNVFLFSKFDKVKNVEMNIF